MPTNPPPKPAPRRPAHNAEPGITAAWLSDLLAGRISVPPGEYTVPASPAPKPTPERWCIVCHQGPNHHSDPSHAYTERPLVRRETMLGAEVEVTAVSPGVSTYRVVKPAANYITQQPTAAEVAALDTLRAEALAAGATEVQDSLIYPPCAEDAEPLAVDAIAPAVVDVLNAITARLEQLRDGGHPERSGGVTEGEQAAWRAGLNRAIALTASSALIASGVGQARRDGA